jgi:hypothetical protein
LLDLGADPNGSDGSPTAWENLLAFLASESVNASNFVKSDYDARFLVLRYLQIMEMLIRSGADLQAFVFGYEFDGRMTAADIVEKFLMPEYPLEAASLMQVLQETMNQVKIDGNRKHPETRLRKRGRKLNAKTRREGASSP